MTSHLRKPFTTSRCGLLLLICHSFANSLVGALQDSSGVVYAVPVAVESGQGDYAIFSNPNNVTHPPRQVSIACGDGNLYSVPLELAPVDTARYATATDHRSEGTTAAGYLTPTSGPARGVNEYAEVELDVQGYSEPAGVNERHEYSLPTDIAPGYNTSSGENVAGSGAAQSSVQYDIPGAQNVGYHEPTSDCGERYSTPLGPTAETSAPASHQYDVPGAIGEQPREEGYLLFKDNDKLP